MTRSLLACVFSLIAWSIAWAAEAPVPAEVPAEVLAQAAQIASAAKQKKLSAVAPPTAETLRVADEIDVLLLASRVLLDQQEPTKGGDRFVSAVKAMQVLSRAERRSLGLRYTEQRQQLMDLAQRLLADPSVTAALDPLPEPALLPLRPGPSSQTVDEENP